MLLGVIADDVTGASDIANTLARGIVGTPSGLHVSQYMGVPNERAAEDIEAGVISLKTRSVAPAEAVRQSLQALEWLRTQGCQQFVFKYCSTFDSTPDGNIGPVGEALAAALGVAGVVACPAFPTAGRTVHQGHLFVGDRLLNESGMQNHPLTPMIDPDLRRWLRKQTAHPVGLVPAAVVRAGPDAVRAALGEAAARGEVLVVADAAADADLVVLGRALDGAKLVTGGSGIALGLPSNFIGRGDARGLPGAFGGVPGPEAILAGSCSGATREQIEVHAKTHSTLAISVERLMSGEVDSGALVTFLEANRGRAPLAYSSGAPASVSASQEKFGREAIAGRLDALFADTARQLVERGVRRLVVAGGETSGAVAQALDLGECTIGPEIDPGVPVLFSRRRGIALAFKSGNFGRLDFFAHALAALAGDRA